MQVSMNQSEKFLREINNAFAENNMDYLIQHVSDDFCWVIVGRNTVSGKAEFSEALEQMQTMPPMNIEVRNILVHGKDAIVEGIVIGRNRREQKKSFGFCDIYRFSDSRELRIQKITSYVIDVSKHKQYKESCWRIFPGTIPSPDFFLKDPYTFQLSSLCIPFRIVILCCHLNLLILLAAPLFLNHLHHWQ